MDLKNTKFCQSCGMPMLPGIAYGTEADGSLSGDYCSYCYGSGSNYGKTRWKCFQFDYLYIAFKYFGCNSSSFDISIG